MKRLLLSFLLCLALAAGTSAAGIDALFISCSVTADGAAEYSMAVSCRFDTQEKSITLPLAGERPSGVTLSGADWSLDSSGGWSRVVAKSSDGFVGRQTFVVSWRAALPAASSGSITLPLVSSRWDEDVAEVTLSIELPDVPQSAPALISGYSGELLNVLELKGVTLSGSLPEGLMAHEALSVELTMPEGTFASHGLRSLLALDWGLVLLAALAGLCILYWARTLRNRRIAVSSRVLPPEGWVPAELPVILSGDYPDMASQLLFWGRLGYLNIDFAGGELVLSQAMPMGSERPGYETTLFRAIFDGRREFWVPDRRLRQAQAQAAQSAMRLWRAQLFDRQGGNPRLMALLAALTAGLAASVSIAALLPVGLGWTLLSVLAFVPGVGLGLLGQQAVGALRRRPWLHSQPLPGLAALLVLTLLAAGRPLYVLPALAMQVFTGWQLAFGGRRSAVGAEALGQLLSLRRFLLRASQRRLQQMLQRDPGWLQTILPYAAQLGLSARLARRIGSVRIEEPAWLRTDEALNTPEQLAAATDALLIRLRGQRRRSLRRRLRQLLH